MPASRHQKGQSQLGTSYLEIIIASATLLIAAHALFTLITASYQLLGISRIHTSARAIANQQMEIIRNLPYNQVGTQGGIPNGSIPQTQTISSNGQEFELTTYIIGIDDPFDNTSPTDLYATDYKKVQVDVSWTSTFPTQDVISLTSNVTPRGLEDNDTGGTLRVLVYDSLGNPVPQAEVLLQAPTADPPIDVSYLTDNNGELIVNTTPTCTDCYNITVSKNMYSIDKTYTTAEVTNPDKPPLTVLENQVSQASFAIDKTSNITFTSYDQNGNILPNLEFNLIGQKTIGTDATGDPTFKYQQTHITDSNGKQTITLEWDNYTINPINYNFAGSNTQHPITVSPDQNTSANFMTEAISDFSLLAYIKEASGSAIASASATLSNASLGFNTTHISGEIDEPNTGHVYFGSLAADTYNIEITHPLFQTYTGTITIEGNNQETFILTP